MSRQHNKKYKARNSIHSTLIQQSALPQFTYVYVWVYTHTNVKGTLQYKKNSRATEIGSEFHNRIKMAKKIQTLEFAILKINDHILYIGIYSSWKMEYVRLLLTKSLGSVSPDFNTSLPFIGVYSAPIVKDFVFFLLYNSRIHNT